MKKKIAKWLLSAAKKLDPHSQLDTAEHYEAKWFGIGYHLSRANVKQFREEHPECKSHKESIDALIEDTKTVILGNIAAGLKDKSIIEYTVTRSAWTADVVGKLMVGVSTEKTKDNGGKKKG